MKTIKTISIPILAVGLLAGSAIGASAQSALVTGDGGWGDEDCTLTPGAVETCAGSWEFSDSRLTGDYELTLSLRFGSGENLEMADILMGDGRLTNADGSWTIQFSQSAFAPDPTWVPDGYPVEVLPESWLWMESPEQFILTGEDGYEGLVAYIRPGPRSYWGVILEPEPVE